MTPPKESGYARLKRFAAARDAAAFDAMCAARPLSPPPLRTDRVARTAAEVEAAAWRKTQRPFVRVRQ